MTMIRCVLLLLLIKSMLSYITKRIGLQNSIINNRLLFNRNLLFATVNINSNSKTNDDANTTASSSILRNFITNIIDDDIANNRNGNRVVTRFPPEPNGYLHIGHAKSINLNFLIAKHYKGVTHMRFDDTNPAKEEIEYVNAILDDVRWLVTGDTKASSPPWHGDIRHASDYFDVIYNSAEYLIKNGLAYVDELTPGM